MANVCSMNNVLEVPSISNAIAALESMAGLGCQFKILENSIKRFICDYEGCTVAFSQYASLGRHSRIHKNVHILKLLTQSLVLLMQ